MSAGPLIRTRGGFLEPAADPPRSARVRPAGRPEKTASPPWTWSWYRWAPGEFWTFAWILAIHLLAVVGLVLFPVPGGKVLLAAFALTWLGGLGTTVAYHRSLAHRSVRLSRPAESILTFFAMINGSSAPATWAANHRLHHARADGPGDISSPRLGGFWWAHLRWLWQAEQAPIGRWAPDLSGPYYRFWTRIQVPIVLLSLLGGAPLGAAAFFWLGPVRLAFALHVQCFVNSIAHMREAAMPGEDSSQNIAWLGVLHFFQGENWHANHHAAPRDPRIGRTPLQWDVGWWTILSLEKVGLASRVRRPRSRPARTGDPEARTEDSTRSASSILPLT
jgi:fatty-acid desaturase